MTDKTMLENLCLTVEADHRQQTRHDCQDGFSHIDCAACMYLRGILRELANRQYPMPDPTKEES